MLSKIYLLVAQLVNRSDNIHSFFVGEKIMDDATQAALDSIKQLLATDEAEKLKKEAEKVAAKEAENVAGDVAADAKEAVEKTTEEEIKELHEKAAKILEEHGGESNIGHRHEYWGIMNKIRGLMRK